MTIGMKVALITYRLKGWVGLRSNSVQYTEEFCKRYLLSYLLEKTYLFCTFELIAPRIDRT
jgi:hypothetical protein